MDPIKIEEKIRQDTIPSSFATDSSIKNLWNFWIASKK